MQTRMNILLADDDVESVIRLKELFHDICPNCPDGIAGEGKTGNICMFPKGTERQRASGCNPWSILNYLDTGVFTDYWANTSSNSLVGKLLREGNRRIKEVFCKALDRDFSENKEGYRE